MADEKRRRAPALATQIDDPERKPDQEDWSAPSTAETRCRSCDHPLPKDARFCPECSWDVSATPPPKKSVDRNEDSIVVDDDTIGAKRVPVPPTPAVASAPPPTPVVYEAPPAPAERRKGAFTLNGEAAQEGRYLLRFLIVLVVVALMIVIVWVVNSHRSTPTPVSEPVSATPISLLRYDAGATD